MVKLKVLRVQKISSIKWELFKRIKRNFCLKIIENLNLTSDMSNLLIAKAEANELISIFVSSIKTAKTNLK